MADESSLSTASSSSSSDSSSAEVLNVEDEIIELEHKDNDEPSKKKSKVEADKYFKYIGSTKKYKCTVRGCSELSEAKNPSQKSQLYRHLRDVHGIGTLTGPKAAPTSLVGTLPTYFERKGDATELSFEEKLAKFIVTTNQPFTVIEQQSFRDLFPKETKWMTATTIQSKILKMFEDRKLQQRNTLKTIAGKISLIIDGWQSPNVCEFVGIIASYIDAQWSPQIRVLDFAVLEGAANAKELASVVYQVLEDFQIADRIHSVTVDNASVMDAMLKQLSTLLSKRDPPIKFDAKNKHIRCLNHILNLSCQNALTVLKDIQPLDDELEIALESQNDKELDKDEEDEGDGPCEMEIDTDDEGNDKDSSSRDRTTLSTYMKIKKIVTKIRKSTTYRGEYNKICEILEVKPLVLIQDVSVRWNSTYLMLERVITMKTVIEAMAQKFAIFKIYMLAEAEWTLIERICQLLQPFYNLTRQLSREDRPALSLAAAVYMDLFQHLEKFKEALGSSATDLQLQKSVERAEDKLEKYWALSGYLSYALGLVLDPVTKLKWYKKVGLNNQVTIANKLIDELWKSEYAGAAESTDSQEAETSTNALSLLRKQMGSNQGANVDELSRYLESETEPAGTDALEWWKSRQLDYPKLSRMAKDALGASATGTPIERKFSMGPLVISRLRSSLKPSTSRAVLCLKAWLKLE